MRELNEAFAHALKCLRTEAKLTQNDFPPEVSREHVSLIERGLRSPSLEMIDLLANKLGIHPLTLVAQCYLSGMRSVELDDLLETVRNQARPDLAR